MIKIKMFCAEDGDSFLLHFGGNSDFNVLIDMGRKNTYTQFIKEELISLNEQQKKLDLLIITHIDEDHIEGAIPFLKENGYNQDIIKVEEIWHNTYRHLQFGKSNKSISSEETRILKQLIAQNASDRDNEGWRDISVKSGVSLGGLILSNGYAWNKSFNGLAASVDNQPQTFNFPIRLTLLSPENKQLVELGREWEKKLQSIFYDFKLSDEDIFDDAFEYVFKQQKDQTTSLSQISGTSKRTIEEYALIEKKDASKINASSIAALIEYDNKKLLFLGDTVPENIVQRLRLLNEEQEFFFDLVKISHHGSAGNTSMELLNLINAKKYLISTNGERHNHPATETISKILIKPSVYKKELIFNYRIAGFDYLENIDMQTKYNFDIKYLNEIEL